MAKKKKGAVQNKQKKKASKATVVAQEESVGRAVLRRLGALGGGLIGGPAGAGFGARIGSDFARYIGFGEYKVARNSILNNGMVPAMHSSNGAMVVRHREYISDVITSGTASTFRIQSFSINPGQDLSYPWLASIARNFQEYSIKGMVYHFQSTSADSMSTTSVALGSVMMATQYRAGAPAFTDKQAMLNEYFSGDSRPSESFAHAIECDPKENPFNIQYVRVGAVPSGEDQKMYDLGTFSIATTGFQATSQNIGELWCTYEVELRKPQLPSQSLGADEIAMYTGVTTIAAATPLGATIAKNLDNIGITVATNSVTFPLGIVGAYRISIFWVACTVWAGANPTPTNCTLQFFGTSGTQQFRTTSAATVGAHHSFIVNILDPGLLASVTFGETTITNATAAILEVERVLPGYWT